jgi:F-type H+-transporting ATPase subunit delta
MQKLSRRRVAEFAADRLAKHESPMKLASYLAAYLVETKQAHQVELLVSDIEQILAQRHGVVVADVTSAVPLSEAIRSSVKKLVTDTDSATQVILNESVDPDLIGGITIDTPSGFYDGSVRKKLRNLLGDA